MGFAIVGCTSITRYCYQTTTLRSKIHATLVCLIWVNVGPFGHGFRLISPVLSLCSMSIAFFVEL